MYKRQLRDHCPVPEDRRRRRGRDKALRVQGHRRCRSGHCQDLSLIHIFARPVIGKKLAEIALAEGADAICHGATGKGNDQVRFELAIKRFAPNIKIIAPWREWNIKSRDEEIDYAEAHHVPLKISRETNYSKDKNLWHLSHEGLDLELSLIHILPRHRLAVPPNQPVLR